MLKLIVHLDEQGSSLFRPLGIELWIAGIDDAWLPVFPHRVGTGGVEQGIAVRETYFVETVEQDDGLLKECRKFCPECFLFRRIGDGDAERLLVAFQFCHAPVVDSAGDKRYALESEERRRRGQNLHRLEEEACARNDCADFATC